MHLVRAVFVSLVLSFKAVKCYEIVNALEKLLNNFDNISSVSTDNWFGLSIADGLLRTSLRGEFPEPVATFEYRKTLLKRIENIRTTSIVRDLAEMPINKRKIIDNIVNMKWTLNNTRYYNALLDDTGTMSIKGYIKVVNNGNPSRELSDFCLAQIDITKSCSLNVECINLLLSRDSYGYHRTHQALILLLLIESNCNKLLPITATKRVIIATICSKIYSEAMVMFRSGIPAMFRDLFLEQVLFCGISGFTEFLQETFITSILSWQNEDGCFSLDVNSIQDKSCYNHVTSLALTFLSNLIRISFL